MGLIGASSAETIAAIDRKETDRARERARERSIPASRPTNEDRDDVVLSIEMPEAIEPADSEHAPGDLRDRERGAYTATGDIEGKAPRPALDLSV